MANNKMTIVVGNIGAGKSTVTEILSILLGFKAVFETVEGHPTLEKFYAAKDKYKEYPLYTHLTELNYESLRTQIFFFFDRLTKQVQSLFCDKHIIADRSIYEDLIFAKVLRDDNEMSETDYFEIYKPMYDTLLSIISKPAYCIYLWAPVEVLKARIVKRGRPSEQNITLDYLRKLQREYDLWADNYDGKIITVDTTKCDLTDKNDPFYKILCGKICQALGVAPIHTGGVEECAC